MEEEKRDLSEYILQEGGKLFGDEFKVETIRNPIGEKSFYKICISQILSGSESFADIDMYIMQTVDGKEVFVCNNGYLRAEVLKKLEHEGKCKVEMRNNRIGYRGDYETKLGVWKRINYFSTQSQSSVGLFLKELFDLSISSREEMRYPDVEIDEFGACVWKMIQDKFNPHAKKNLKVEYYPTFDSKEENYCDTFIIWLNIEEEEEFYVKINRFPEYQEFVCSYPGKYWRVENRSTMTEKMKKHYDEKMLELEEKFIKALHRVERKSILLMGPDEKVPYVHVAEVRTSNSKVVEVLLNKLRENKNNYALQRAIKEDKDYQYKKEIHTNFY